MSKIVVINENGPVDIGGMNDKKLLNIAKESKQLLIYIDNTVPITVPNKITDLPAQEINQ